MLFVFRVFNRVESEKQLREREREWSTKEWHRSDDICGGEKTKLHVLITFFTLFASKSHFTLFTCNNNNRRRNCMG